MVVQRIGLLVIFHWEWVANLLLVYLLVITLMRVANNQILARHRGPRRREFTSK
jgi:hypothetical protein